ncbi:SRPBCC domain-containing protein [Kocuria palustris]|uniref:SRPBCC domain-containing protein n=1 Tax=Kocuria palustris TaxID=71999 RepID=UPI0028D52541|nr:SRPBCC domain-containing protein [Kocuria palustris]
MTTTDTSVTVTREINAPAAEIFQILSLPARHVDFDGSGNIKNGSDQRIEKAGDVFTMDMHREDQGGDYKTDNTVTGFDPNKLIAWKPARQGTTVEDNGWEWVWELESLGEDQTRVTQTYTWKDANPEILKKVHFPMISEAELEESMNRLASVVAS